MPQNPIAQINAHQPIVNKDGEITPLFQSFIAKISQCVVVVGTGSPEGVFELPQYTQYIDESTPLSPVTYRKMLPEVGGDRSKGWAVA